MFGWSKAVWVWVWVCVGVVCWREAVTRVRLLGRLIKAEQREEEEQEAAASHQAEGVSAGTEIQTAGGQVSAGASVQGQCGVAPGGGWARRRRRVP